MEELDIRERGGMRNGEPQFLDRRLFMQLLAFGGARDTGKLIGAMDAAHIPGVLYEDVNDPQGIAVLTWGGLRGGISIALALSLEPSPYRGSLLAVCYAVVVFTIIVQGFTDNQPITTAQFPSNWSLSAERAVTVVELFASDKVNGNQLAAEGFGAFGPIG